MGRALHQVDAPVRIMADDTSGFPKGEATGTPLTEFGSFGFGCAAIGMLDFIQRLTIWIRCQRAFWAEFVERCFEQSF